MSGTIVKVSGPLVVANGMSEANVADIVRVGEQRLVGEILNMTGDSASIVCRMQGVPEICYWLRQEQVPERHVPRGQKSTERLGEHIQGRKGSNRDRRAAETDSFQRSEK